MATDGDETKTLTPTDPAHGLSQQEAARRLETFGPNRLPTETGTSLATLIWRQLASFIALMLLMAAGLSAVLGYWDDCIAILLALLINAVVGVAMEYRADKAIRALQDLTAPSALVRRDGQDQRIPAESVVPGDLVRLSEGDRIPADGRLTGGSCTVDESLLTGESLPVTKSVGGSHAPADLFAASTLAAGTLVMAGSAQMVTTATGADSNVGRIAGMLAGVAPTASPLTRRLDVLGHYLVWTIAAIAVVIFGLGLWQGLPLAQLIRTTLVLAIAAIPEGLPIIATLALAVGARRLSTEGALLRRLPALETLGTVSVLCLDKTGTITANALTVQAISIPGHDLTVSGTGWAPVGTFQEAGVPIIPDDLPGLRQLLLTVALCNTASLTETPEGWRSHGDPSDGALLVAAAKGQVQDLRPDWERRFLLPVDHGRPWMVAVHDTDTGPEAFIKGAPEIVLDRCTRVWSADGARPLDAATRAIWTAKNAALASQAMRVLGVATKPIGEDGDCETGWLWLGLAGMVDPPRDGVREAVQAAHRAGLRTIMITGDQPATARAIAQLVGLTPGGEVTVAIGTGQDGTIADVYARAKPEDKLTLVQRLQQDGAVAVMTGDGVNDAPALRAAAVGVAMGGGADVAKQAAAMVLTDERLATLLMGVREGRTAFLNMQKGLDYMLTCSLATMLTVLMATLAGHPLPLLPLQILYLNLMTHTFPALALTLEPAQARVMQRPPLSATALLLPPVRLATIVWHALIIGLVTVSMAAWGLAHGTADHARTLVFATLAASLMAHVFTDRSPQPFGGWTLRANSQFLLYVGAAVALAAGAVVVTPLATWLGMTPLAGHDWLGVAVAGAASFVAVELSKWALPPAAEPV
jgi:Ca2+-transporting ATPase